ncbi:MAG: hypothetical protein FJ240_11830 [Nitrospira sp.]|nr:hypothetical protein [Nitrospira sp.]
MLIGHVNVNKQQAVEKVFFLSLRAKRSNLAFNKINGLEIASSQKLLLAMTCDEFFNSLASLTPCSFIRSRAVSSPAFTLSLL